MLKRLDLHVILMWGIYLLLVFLLCASPIFLGLLFCIFFFLLMFVHFSQRDPLFRQLVKSLSVAYKIM